MVGLLILLGPFLAILIWKAIRRSRRRSGEPQDSMHGGWDEYLDSAADAGLAAMPLATRHEVAAAYGSAHGPEIARLTDKAAVGAVAGAQDEADRLHTMPQAHSVSLGPRILRADTAAVAALTIWQTVMGDWT